MEKKAYEKHLPDIHVVLIDYLEELGDGVLALEIMPKISYKITENIYPCIPERESYESFLEVCYPDLNPLLWVFSDELSKWVSKEPDEIFKEVNQRVLKEVEDYYSKRKYKVFERR